MIILPSLMVFFSGQSYIFFVFFLTFIFGLIFKLVR